MKKCNARSIRMLLVGTLLMLCPVAICAANGDKFKLVKNTSELNDGDKIIIVKTADENMKFNSALSINYKENATTIYGTRINVDGEIATANGETEIIKVEKSGSAYYFKAAQFGMYICNNATSDDSSSKIKLSSDKSKSSSYNGKMSITITSDNDAVIIFDKVTGLKERQFCFNPLDIEKYPNANGFFGCYRPDFKSDKSRLVKIYKEVATQVSLAEDADNADAIAANAGKTVNVSLSRTLVADKWNTFCVPFDIDLTDGTLGGVEARVMKFACMEGERKNIMCFELADKIEAGEAYLVKPTGKNIANPTFYGVALSGSGPNNSGSDGYAFVGVYSKKTFNDAESKVSLFINGNAELNRPKASSTINGMRAYFVCPSEQAAAQQLLIGGEVTGLSTIVNNVDADGNIYNINGVCIGNDAKTLEKGIYIRNGKKFVVK